MRAFQDIVKPPIEGRMIKPRKQGLTMVIDKGLGLRAAEDMAEIASEIIDIVKLGFGTARTCPMNIVKKKVEVYRKYDIHVMTGGTLLEVVVAQGNLESFLHKARSLGLDAIEVSDGTIPMSSEKRTDVIRTVSKSSFIVIAEVGSKFTEMDLSAEEMIRGIKQDLELGALQVIVEAREAGRGVGIYDEKGEIVSSKLDEIVREVDVKNVMFEAPEKHQQVELIKKFGVNVNLGNIQPTDIVALEALRIGLRADTLRGIYT